MKAKERAAQWREEQPAWHARLGISDDVKLSRASMPAPADMAFRIDTIGIPQPDGRHLVRYLAVRHPATTAYLEMTWHDNETTEMVVRGLDADTPGAVWDLLKRMHRIARFEAQRRGKPVGPQAYKPEDMARRVMEAKKALKRRGQRLTYVSIAAEMEIPDTTYGDYVRQYGVPGPND